MTNAFENAAPALPAGVMDIDSLDVVTASEAGIEVEIVSPRGGKTGLVFKVTGGFAERFQERLARAQKAAQLRESNPVANAVGSDEQDIIDLLAAMSLNWGTRNADGSVTWGCVPVKGQMLEHNRANAKIVYANPIIRKQLFQAAVSAANFVKG